MILDGDSLHSTSKLVLRRMPCTWEGCSAVLNCWGSFHNHQLQHSKIVRSQLATHTKYQCCLPKCTSQPLDSSEALKIHIEKSHLARLQVPCPLQGCVELIPNRVTSFLSHLEVLHHKHVGIHADCPGPLFQPLALPFNPPSMPLCTLPQQMPPWYMLCSPLVIPSPKQTVDVKMEQKKEWWDQLTVEEPEMPSSLFAPLPPYSFTKSKDNFVFKITKKSSWPDEHFGCPLPMILPAPDNQFPLSMTIQHIKQKQTP